MLPQEYIYMQTVIQIEKNISVLRNIKTGTVKI